MSALNRKLWRDLARLKGQVVTIALVLACAILAFLMMHTTLRSLELARDDYYDRYRFADVFASLERAPNGLAAELLRIEGVVGVQTRVVVDVMVPMAEELEPLIGRVVSLPPSGRIELNDLHLTRGRLPRPEARDEVVILDQFAAAHGLRIGDELPIVLGGRLRDLHIVGIGMSPEYVFAMSAAAGAADERKFVVLWMAHELIATSLKMEGAFNDVALRVQPQASLDAVLASVQRILRPYGVRPPISRESQPSHYTLKNELSHLGSLAFSIPLAFLGVAAFLVSVVVSRLVFLERGQIAVLKALGYTNQRIALHYVGLVLGIVWIGSVLGVASGVWAGRWMTSVYMRSFRFPVGEHVLSWDLVAKAVMAALLSALGGALVATLRAARTPPAQAMQPATPLSYHRGQFLGSKWLVRWTGTVFPMILREVARRPLRFAMSASGIAMGIAIYLLGSFSWDSFDYLFYEVFPRRSRADVIVSFTSARPARAVRELGAIPGVLHAEGLRSVEVRFLNGHHTKLGTVTALPRSNVLRPLLDQDRFVVSVPEEGLLMTARLAERLQVRAGDRINVEVFEGTWPTLSLPIVGLIDESFGLQAYASQAWWSQLVGESPRVTSVSLQLDARRADEVRARFKDMPFVLTSSSLRSIIANHERQTGDIIFVITMLLAISAAAISTGVVYNNARVALSLRSRELASLRVLGYTRAEVSAILLGELALQVVVGLPLGMLLGTWWATLQAGVYDADALRFPMIIAPKTYGMAGLIALCAGVLSALLVRRRLDRLDLVSVLKARE